jgi:hypothetical protein
LPLDTKLSVKATIPVGTVLYTTNEAACARLGQKLFCGRCDCSVVANATILDLTDADSYFSEHDYTCSFTNTAPGIVMGCAG